MLPELKTFSLLIRYIVLIIVNKTYTKSDAIRLSKVINYLILKESKEKLLYETLKIKY